MPPSQNPNDSMLSRRPGLAPYLLGGKKDSRYACLRNCPLEVLTMTTTTTTACTSSGKLRGIADEGLVIFRGIQYAQPPVGHLRFAPPQPPDSWTGTREASIFGPRA